jgi:hypothetical protein
MQIAGLRRDISSLRQRHDGWTMTHEWDGEAGVWRSIVSSPMNGSES